MNSPSDTMAKSILTEYELHVILEENLLMSFSNCNLFEAYLNVVFFWYARIKNKCVILDIGGETNTSILRNMSGSMCCGTS